VLGTWYVNRYQNLYFWEKFVAKEVDRRQVVISTVAFFTIENTQAYTKVENIV
jgi:hypothetical protein